MAEIGPVQLIGVGFGPEAEFEGKILGELTKLEAMGTVRLLDLLFLRHSPETGQYVVLDYQGEELGAIVGALLGFEFEGAEEAQAAPADGHHAFGLAGEDIEELLAKVEPGCAAGFILIEHVWARDLRLALRGAGGVLLGEGFLTPEVVAGVAAELAVVSEALNEQADAG